MKALGGLIVCLLISQFTWADEQVSLMSDNQVQLVAKYLEGDEDAPVVMIVHGFLQTNSFPTVARLTDGLNFGGYSVLAPTLSLGIDGRKRSLQCDALHFHSMDQTVNEIRRWVQWLSDKGHRDIRLLGHSFGNLSLLAYVEQFASDPNREFIKGLSFISLTSIQGELHQKHTAEAKQDMIANPKRPGTYSLVHCNPYKTIPQMYLSYTRWNPQTIAKTMENLDIPRNIIIGTEDSRINEMPDTTFYSTLEEQGATLIRVKGASHFFDNEFADILNDTVLELVSEND